MQTVNPNQATHPTGSPRATALFQQAEDLIYRRTDRMFAILMVLQWLAGIAAALWISPRTWIGATSEIHWHVWAAIYLGGIIASFPVYVAWKYPGRPLTRHTIAVAQMFFSALLIHLTGGRIETHFHIFGSLAFLAIYRDWKVLVSATVVVAADHFLRSTYWPQSVFGVLAPSPWRWLEHAGWVVFEDTFLIISIRQSLNDMLGVAERQASLETINADIERQVSRRTEELTKEIAVRERAEEELRESQGLYHSLVEQLPISVYRKDAQGRYVFVNSRFCEIKGLPADRILGQTSHVFNSREVADRNLLEHESIMKTGKSIELEETWPTPDGAGTLYFQAVKLPVTHADGRIVGTQGVQFDITQRKQAEKELVELHKQLVDASRQAGMAEVATSVLHNVGNVLNSVNVSSSMIIEKLRTSKAPNLARAVALIQSHEQDLAGFFTNDPKGRQLPGYLSGLAAHLAQEQADLLSEAGSLLSNVVHINEIVAMQQSYGRRSAVLELLKLEDSIEDAIRMNLGSIDRHQIKVKREYAEVPPVLTDKHKVLQILVNLIRNAKHACDDSGREDKQITLRLANGDGRIKVSVIDNGVGIPAENLTRIFNHGFTTKKDGHGYGLHSGALAAKEMGGSLVALSDGLGQGAAFTLEFPVKQPRTNV